MVSNDQPAFAEFPSLETDRLILREPGIPDAADVFVFRSDPIEQRFNSEAITDISQAEELITLYQAKFVRGGAILWGVTLKGADTVIGLINLELGLGRVHHNRGELGYDLARAYWGKGIGSEAVREVVRFGFESLNLNRIEAETIEDNLESRRLLDKLGFVCEGIRRGYSLEDDGNYHGSAVYGLLRTEFRSEERYSVSLFEALSPPPACRLESASTYRTQVSASNRPPPLRCSSLAMPKCSQAARFGATAGSQSGCSIPVVL
jgi:ribosomal-protein-alanine N-acetyltransferase